MSTVSSSKLLKTVPGFLISAFFLWYTFKGISPAQFRSLRIVSPVWILGLVGFGIVSYTLRCVRWHRMMRSTGASLLTCSRVFMTSLAANNILPLRIGDIMRIFTYAPDLNTTPSVIMSTILLEKLLDIFVLVSLFTLFLGPNASPHSRLLAHGLMAFSVIGLAVLLLGARTLDAPLRRLFTRLPKKPIIEKLEHWVLLALECIRNIGVAGSLLLLVQSIIIWSCEGLQFYSAARILGVQSSPIGPWQAVSTANFAFLIPSSPGGIGPFEWATQTAMVSHGADPSQAALYALALHVWMLITITGVGGAMFLAHRIRNTMRKPLLEEIETLPAEMP
ncbi:lysylphosphatidylglycerol synthase transmembrane domain-containing protein [Granulicella sibirica]|uniref:Uncharacterized protein n=1 Tax=Granulicella sibirica TaxID=2479048 RepID=A0A4V1L5S1_9BACT|nr:lysylphosphatidylglycerol synthase transmembrane domain-containing protein [Granulicella sibirica]RXH56744.1 hypothetical protein GRAN_0054 [Granulicella sibirica]